MKETEGMRMTLNEVCGYLASKGIPRSMINRIRLSLIYDAVTQGSDIKYDRIYAGMALMLRRAYGFGQERILKGLHMFDQIAGSVIADDDNPSNKDWMDIMAELKAETGIVIHTGDDNRLICEVSRD